MVQHVQLRLETRDIPQVARLLPLKLLVSLLDIRDVLDLLVVDLLLHLVDRVVGVPHEIQRLLYALLLV